MTGTGGDWAVVDPAIRGDAGILLIVETRDDAEAIAFELRRGGRRVAAVQLGGEALADNQVGPVRPKIGR